MARGKALSEDLRKVLINLSKSGKSAYKIAKELNLSKYTVRDIIRVYKETNSIVVRPRTGRISAITPAELRILGRIVKKNRYKNCSAIVILWNDAFGKQYSTSTCRRAMKKIGFNFYKSKEKPLLTKIQEKRRKLWAQNHKNWTQRQWNSIIWSDESRFELCVGESRNRVIRQKSETYHKDCLRKKVKFPVSIMVWGCMSANGVGKLHIVEGIVNAQKYKNILDQYLLPSIEALESTGGEYIFQQDGAPCHTAKCIKSWMAENKIPLLEWPSSSPDLSPIETLWNQMKKKLRNRPPRTNQELRTRLNEIWNSFSREECQKLVETMPRRIDAVLKNKGEITQW